jgi:hypothetical protein
MAAPLHDKKADLAGPGIGNYDELEKILPQDYSSLLTPKEVQKAIFAAKWVDSGSLPPLHPSRRGRRLRWRLK